MHLFLSLLALAVVSLVLGCKPASAPETGAAGGQKVTVAFMPKSKGNAYFMSCRQGADAAAKELGIELIFDGPTDPDPAKQNEIVEQWINLGVDAIAVACENRDGISTALRKARAKGIKVVTYDADAQPDAREFFVNQATVEGIGNALTDEAARLLNGAGEYAIITASLTAGNMIAWQQAIEKRNAEKYPQLKRVALRPCDDLKDKAQSEATALLSANPNLKLIMAICSPAVPGAAEAIKQAGKTGQVKLIGLGLPNENRRYVQDGVTDTVILWKTLDLGYLTIHAATALATVFIAGAAVQWLRDGLGLKKLSITDIFRFPVLSALAAHQPAATLEESNRLLDQAYDHSSAVIDAAGASITASSAGSAIRLPPIAMTAGAFAFSSITTRCAILGPMPGAACIARASPSVIARPAPSAPSAPRIDIAALAPTPCTVVSKRCHSFSSRVGNP